MKQIACLLVAFAFAISANAQLSFTTLNSSTTANLLGISFADTSVGYACGENGIILKTGNGGTTWTQLTSGTTNKLWDIKVIPQSAGQKIIAVGDNNTVIKSVNGGTSWTAQTIPFAAGSFVFGIFCLDSSNYFACGGDFTTTSGAVLKTVNGGTTWTSTTVSGSVFLDKIFMVNGTTGFTAGTNTSFSDGSIQKTTTGIAWTGAKTSSNIISNVWCKSATDIVAVGIGGQIWRSTDGGANWASKSFNTTDLYGIAFKDATRGFACGGSPSGCIILSTNNGGNTWTQEPYSFNGALQSACVIGNKLFLAGDGGRIAKAAIAPAAGIAQSDEEAVAGLLLYPNPATNWLSIANPKHLQGLKLRLVNVSGCIVAEKAISDKGGAVGTDSFVKGIYGYSFWQDGQLLKAGTLSLQ